MARLAREQQQCHFGQHSGGSLYFVCRGVLVGGVGSKAEGVKQTLEKKAQSVEKSVEKGIEAVKPGEKK